jgi:hypothetical protein
MPIMSPEQIRDIVNSIPSFRFEEAQNRPETARSSISVEGS